MRREAEFLRSLVELADTLVDDFDIVELLTGLTERCVALLDVAAAGVMMVSPRGELHLVGSSSEAMRVVEAFELQAQEGPCLDAFHTGKLICHERLDLDPRAFADMATISVLQHQASTEIQEVNAQLAHALSSRILVEQAKGVIFERAGVGMDEAFSRLRGYARGHGLLLSDVARAAIEGTLDPSVWA